MAEMAKHTLFLLQKITRKTQQARQEGQTVWYVIQVRTGNEEDIRTQCGQVVDPAILKKCFIPYYEGMKRYHGEWHKERKILFPGYVFLISEDKESLYYELKKVVGLTKLIGTGREVVPLSDEEVSFLKNFGSEEQIVEISEGVIENSQVVITSGPLKGNEGLIRRIDRHKRKAYLEIEMFGRKIETQVGLEIVEKK